VLECYDRMSIIVHMRDMQLKDTYLISLLLIFSQYVEIIFIFFLLIFLMLSS